MFLSSWAAEFPEHGEAGEAAGTPSRHHRHSSPSLLKRNIKAERTAKGSRKGVGTQSLREEPGLRAA